MKPIVVEGWTTWKGGEGVEDLSACRGTDGAIYSLWRPSIKERLQMLFGRPIVLGVLSDRQPPVSVTVLGEVIQEPFR
jgi:hypothetical protein